MLVQIGTTVRQKGVKSPAQGSNRETRGVTVVQVQTTERQATVKVKETRVVKRERGGGYRGTDGDKRKDSTISVQQKEDKGGDATGAAKDDGQTKEYIKDVCSRAGDNSGRRKQ